MLAFLRNTKRDQDESINQEQLENKLGWIRTYRRHLQDWDELLHLAETTEQFVRVRGFYRQCPQELKQVLTLLVRTQRGQMFYQRLMAYVAEESKKAKPRERLLGSSEVIESVFGKWKRLEREQAHSGITGLILCIGAMVSQTNAQTVQQALEAVSTREVLEWCRKQVGPTIQAKRKQAFARAKKEQKRDHF